MELKVCNCCKKELPLCDFSKSRRIKSGYKGTCKKCHSMKEKKRRDKNPEQYREQRAKYRANNIEKIKEQKRRSYKKHKANISRKVKEKRKDADWVSKENQRLREYNNRSNLHRLRKQARSRVSFPGWSKEEIHCYLISTFYLNYGRTPLCTEEVHIDHIVPLSWAKTDKDIKYLKDPKNVQLLLAVDNLLKKDYIADYREGILL